MVDAISSFRVGPTAPPPNAAAPAPTPDDGLLRLGSSGPRVADLQRQLNALGEQIPVNGQFGPRTQEAVRRFQLRSGVRPVDGSVDVRTSQALAQAPRNRDAFQAAPASKPPVNLSGAPPPPPAAGGGLTTAYNDARLVAAKGLGLKGAVEQGIKKTAEVGKSGFGETLKKSLASATEAKAGVTLTVEGLAKKGLTGLDVATRAVQLPEKIAKTAADLSTAVQRGDSKSINKAGADVADVAKSVGTIAKGGLELSADAHKLVAAGTAAAKAFAQEMPEASVAAVAAVAKRAGIAVLGGKTAEEVAKVVGERAATSAAEAGARALAGPLARAAGRFAPGVNIGLAAADTALAVAAYRDPEASVGKKVTAAVTALGSVVSATNVPIVSQVGAAVSAVSGIVGGVFFSK